MTNHAPGPQADGSNWRTPEHSRWAFQHIADILPTAPIVAAPQAARPLPTASAAFDGFALKVARDTTFDLDGFLAATATDAIVVLRDGQLVHERYTHGMTQRTPHIVMSMSKAITGAVAGLLASDGALDLEAAVANYVPEVAATGYAGASLRQLLDMRAGARLTMPQMGDYEATMTGAADAPTLPAILTALEAPQPHGGPFAYISANTDLVGWAMERATGRTFAQLASDLLWKPMGAEHDAAVMVDREGSAWCSGGVCATARDLARLGALIADDGVRDGVPVLPKAWIDDLCEGGDRQAWSTGEWGAAFSGISRHMSYRSGWYTADDIAPALFAMGTHGQNLFIDRARKIVIAKLSSQPQRIDGQLIGLTHLAAAEIVHLLS